MIINKKKISILSEPYIIAELSGNHEGNINNFFKLINIAKKAGANAIKLQTFKPDKITINSRKKFFIVKHKFKKWDKKTLYELYKKSYTPWEWHQPLKILAHKNKLDFIATPFHESAVDFLAKLKVSCIKISSFEFNDHNLVEYASKKKIPMILSSGMASKEEIKTNYNIVKKNLKNNFAILKCSSNYPATYKDLNLKTISELRKKLNCEIGYSDHTTDNVASLVAISKGASIIEKHICLDKSIGIDSNFSLTPNKFMKFVIDCKLAWKALGKIKYGPTISEKNSFKSRRSLFAIKEIKIGEKFDKENIASVRPRDGLSPRFFKKLIGKKSKKKFSVGDPIK